MYIPSIHKSSSRVFHFIAYAKDLRKNKDFRSKTTSELPDRLFLCKMKNAIPNSRFLNSHHATEEQFLPSSFTSKMHAAYDVRLDKRIPNSIMREAFAFSYICSFALLLHSWSKEDIASSLTQIENIKIKAAALLQQLSIDCTQRWRGTPRFAPLPC